MFLGPGHVSAGSKCTYYRDPTRCKMYLPGGVSRPVARNASGRARGSAVDKSASWSWARTGVSAQSSLRRLRLDGNVPRL